MEYLRGLLGPSDHGRLMRNFSLNEFALLAGTYKHMFKEQLQQPTADNNHIVNYNLKLQNYVIVNSTIHMISAGMFTFLVKGLIGGGIERHAVNYLGSKRGLYAQVLVYFGVFFVGFSWLNNSPRLNVSHLVNPRDFNGEVMSNLVLKFYPHKIN